MTVQMHKVCKGIFLSAILVSGFFVFRTASADTAIYISQVQITGGTGHTSDDFIELFNPNPVPVNLKGYRLVKRTANGSTDTSIKSWTSDAVIPAYSFYLWANSGFSSIAKTPDVTTSGTLANDNGIALRLGADNTGAIVDSLAWGTANNGFKNISAANPAANLSLLRKDLYGATSEFSIGTSNPRNSAVVDPAAPALPQTDTAQPTTTPATTTNLSLETGMKYVSKSDSVKIVELLVNPSGEDSGHEQVELQNFGSDPVDLQGWFLGNKSDSGVKANDWKITGESILPDRILLLTIPKGYFSMVNSGDVLNLYYGDKTLADSAVYKDAPEGQSYQKIGDAWVFSTPSLGKKNFEDTPQLASDFKIYVSEFMPNPDGPDEGNEWVELYNDSDSAANLNGFLLDSDNEAVIPSAAAWKLSQNYVIPAHNFLALAVPEGMFALANTHDAVRVFGPDKKIIDRVFYKDAPEGQSYYRNKAGEWHFGVPTKGDINISEIPEFSLAISEILPNPGSGQEEFIELYNASEAEADIKNFKIQIGSKSKTLDSLAVPPHGFAVLYGDSLPSQLRNSGQVVSFSDPYGRELTRLSYDKAPAGKSYALQGGAFNWTENITPGSENGSVLGVVLAAEPEQKTVTKTPAKAKTASSAGFNSEKSLQELLTVNSVLTSHIGELEKKIDGLTAAAQQARLVPEAQAASPTEPEKALNARWYLVTALLGLALVFVLVKDFFKKSARSQ